MSESPILVFDLKDFSKKTAVERTAIMNRIEELIDEALTPLFLPTTNPWASLVRESTGDGYYIILYGQTPHAGLFIARKLQDFLTERRSPDLDPLIRLRVVLGLGTVNQVSDRLEGEVMIQTARILDGPTLRSALDTSDSETVLAATPEFLSAWRLDETRKLPALSVGETNWHSYADADKRGREWQGHLFDLIPVDQTKLTDEISASPTPSPTVNIVAFISHTIDEPLAEALEWATALVNAAKQSSGNIRLRLVPASGDVIRQELRNEPDYVFYFGHGDEYGRLILNDGAANLDDLEPALWESLKGCFLFACYSSEFAQNLNCPYLSFDWSILRQAPHGFVHALFRHWGDADLADAIPRARADCEREMEADFTDAFNLSAAAISAPPPSRRWIES
jgi:hypothetical protein